MITTISASNKRLRTKPYPEKLDMVSVLKEGIEKPKAKINIPKRSLGSTRAPGLGIGTVIGHTWEDIQTSYVLTPRRVASNPNDTQANIHFVYTAAHTPIPADWGRVVYVNTYDPIASQGSFFPLGDEGISLQPNRDSLRARNGKVNALPDGRGVWHCEEGDLSDVSLGYPDGLLWVQANQHDTSMIKYDIDRSIYESLLFQPNNVPGYWSQAVQVNGLDTIYHLLGVEWDWDASRTNLYFGLHPLMYFRKVNDGGTWSAVTLNDTITAWGMIGASPVSGDVCAAYLHYTESADSVASRNPTHNASWEDEDEDNDIYIVESHDYGTTWDAISTNMTNYNREISSASVHINGGQVQVFYDSEGELHVIWTEFRVKSDPYNNPGTRWNGFESNLMHWSRRVPGDNAGGIIIMIQRTTYGDAINYYAEDTDNMCGATENSFLNEINIAECNGRLYAVYQTSLIDHEWGVQDTTDCSTFPNFYGAHNGEIGLNVSTSLDGLLWDAQRDLDGTKHPGQGTATGCDGIHLSETGICPHEKAPSLDLFGYDVTSVAGGIGNISIR